MTDSTESPSAGSSGADGAAARRRYRNFRKVGYRPVAGSGEPDSAENDEELAEVEGAERAEDDGAAEGAEIDGSKRAEHEGAAATESVEGGRAEAIEGGESGRAEAIEGAAAGSRRGTPEPGTPTTQPTQGDRQDQPAQVATATLPPPSPWQGPPRYPTAGPMVVPTPAPLLPWWTPPATPASSKVLVAGLVAGLGAAVLAPPNNGIGWFLAGLFGVGAVLFYAGKPSIERALWLAGALAFLAMGFLRAAEWIFPLCVLASMMCGSIAMAGGRTVRGLVFGALGVGLGGLRSLPWVAKGLSKRGPVGIRPLISVGVAVALLLIFGSLLAGADRAFGKFLESLVPDLEIDGFVRSAFFGGVAAFGALGACYLVAAPPKINEDAAGKPGSLRVKDYALPVGVLVLLFAGFVGTQLAVLFGGEKYVMETAGVTFAEYARSGFWQLLWVSILTLGVIAGVARFAAKKTAQEQLWLRILLGSLAVLTLVIVASALSRMWFYQQAYGWTVLRLLVSSCEIWLAVVYLMVIGSGITLRADWLPKAIVGTGTAFFLAVLVMNPEQVVADYNVSRFEATRKIDAVYLSRLSEDAVPALVRLPEPQRSCSLRWLKDRHVEQDWREWNLARHNAHKSLESVAVTDVTCESTYSGER